MLIPLLSFLLSIILVILFYLFYQEISFFKKFSLFVKHKEESLLWLAYAFLCLGLALGLVGYFNLFNGIIEPKDLQSIRRNLLIGSLISFIYVFRQDIVFLIRKTGIIKFWIFLKSYCYIHRTSLMVMFLLGIIAYSLMAPMASSRVIFSINDNPSHLGYLIQAKMALEEGQFPIRVAPLEDFGFRYPGFQFYSQLPYLLGAIIYKFITPTNPYNAYKMMFWLALWIGGFFIYKLGLFLTRSQIAAILAGVSYMSAPYFLINIYARGAFTEAIAQGILPIVLYFIFKFYQKPKLSYLILSALSWFLLAITHIITFVYSSILIFSLLFLICRLSQISISRLRILVIPYVWGWLLALYFLAPVVLESSSVSIRQQIDAGNPFYSRWLTPSANLLSPTSLPPEPTELGMAPTYGLHPAVGWIFLAAFGTVVYYSFSSSNSLGRLKFARPIILALLIIFLLAFVLAWSPANFWELLPRQLWVTQFPFRFLTHVTWAGSLLTTFAVVSIFRERLYSRHLVLGILLIIMVSRPWLPIPRGTVTVDEVLKEPLFRFSGALDYLYRTPQETLYGNTELHYLPNNWIPGYVEWDSFVNRALIFDQKIYYPKWQTQENPILSLEGEVYMENIQDKATLLIKIDDQILASIPLTQRELIAKIPLKNVKISEEINTFSLDFLVKGKTKDGTPLSIRMNKFQIDGLLPQNTVTPVNATQKMCQQKGSITSCDITVQNGTGIAQLPVLYYPRMLKIWVNNQRVEGFPVNYRDFNLLGLKLPPGQYQIQVKFVGLTWANWISFLGWLGIILMAILNKMLLKNNEQKKTIKIL
jgi:hypothetical protein